MKLPAFYKSTALAQAPKSLAQTKPPHIGFILDESGSMAMRKDEAIYSFNLLLRQQVTTKRKASFGLTTFGSKVRVGPVVDMHQCRALRDDDYSPRGDTPLFDAIGETIGSVDSSLNYPINVVLIIFTDGHENASKQWKLEGLHALIQEKLTIGWQFIYCSCAHNPVADGLRLGIPRECITDFTNLPEVFKRVSNLLTDFRRGDIKRITFDKRG